MSTVLASKHPHPWPKHSQTQTSSSITPLYLLLCSLKSKINDKVDCNIRLEPRFFLTCLLKKTRFQSNPHFVIEGRYLFFYVVLHTGFVRIDGAGCQQTHNWLFATHFLTVLSRSFSPFCSLLFFATACDGGTGVKRKKGKSDTLIFLHCVYAAQKSTH